MPDAVLLVGVGQFYPVSCISLASMQSKRAQHLVQGSAMSILVCLTFLPVGLHCRNLHLLISHSITETHSQLNVLNHFWIVCPIILFCLENHVMYAVSSCYPDMFSLNEAATNFTYISSHIVGSTWTRGGRGLPGTMTMEQENLSEICVGLEFSSARF